MRLDELMQPAAAAGSTQISALAYDSRQVSPGTLFFCVPGAEHDGHEFAAQAVRDGAVAVVLQRPLGLTVPEIRVQSVRAAMGPVAARFYARPSSQLAVIGVTGTNGKTTTAFLLGALMARSGRQCGLLGTVKSVIAGVERPAERTTPEAIDLQRTLAAMRDGGDRACAMEVSSHALQLQRTNGIQFAAAIFTNLTQDHLDFHPSMEDYYRAKRLLFFADEDQPTPPPRVSVVNIGDSYGQRLARELPQAITFAVQKPADYSASDLRCDLNGCSFTLRTPAGEQTARLPMPGRFNVANALGALAAAHALGCPLQELIEALADGVRVPGRFEPVDEGQDFAVLVDYAHTPDSLENVLRAARDVTASAGTGRVICVFGAGGDRDRGKRPLMGEIAVSLAEIVFVTSDNPRSEDPRAIIDEIFQGIHDPRRPPNSAHTANPITDRRQAIETAIGAARAGDVLVIAGKGHEQGQEFAAGHKLPFDDVAVARTALAARVAVQRK